MALSTAAVRKERANVAAATFSRTTRSFRTRSRSYTQHGVVVHSAASSHVNCLMACHQRATTQERVLASPPHLKHCGSSVQRCSNFRVCHSAE